MRQKRGIFGKVFIYMLSAVIVVLILYFGYDAINDVHGKAKTADLVRMQNDLTSTMKFLSQNYGKIRTKTITLPPEYEQLCFVDVSKKEQILTRTGVNYYIRDSLESGAKYNVFILGENIRPIEASPIKIEKEPYFLCFAANETTININLRGVGGAVEVQ